MENPFDELKILIDHIEPLYAEMTAEWQNRTDAEINLKKLMVSDIDADGSVYKTILGYVQFLNERSAAITLQLSSVCSYKVRARVKAQNSIEYKIFNYMTERHEFGKVPINKCFNDLLGVRIVLGSPLTYDEIRAFIETTYPGKYKCINSTKPNFGYKAVHIYFKESNRSFQWELQIWNACDEQANIISHSKYKQGYTVWENEIKKGGTVNG